MKVENTEKVKLFFPDVHNGEAFQHARLMKGEIFIACFVSTVGKVGVSLRTGTVHYFEKDDEIVIKPSAKVVVE
jgi:hypothetical protein